MQECRRALPAARKTPRSPASVLRAGLRWPKRRRIARSGGSSASSSSTSSASRRRSEQLDPEDVRAILTPYHGTVRDELESFGGVVEKFVGDAVMAVFGAPTAHGDDPERAVRAALAVRDAVAALNIEQPELELRIRGAVNTGEAVVTLYRATGARRGHGRGRRREHRLTPAAACAGRRDRRRRGDLPRDAERDRVRAPRGGDREGQDGAASRPGARWRRPRRPASGTCRARRSSAAAGRSTSSTATWERVELERRPHLITVLGPPGVGKSRLSAEFTDRISTRGGRVVRGRCLPYRERSAVRRASRCRSRISPASTTATASTLPPESCARSSSGSSSRSRPRPSPGTSRSCSASRRRRPPPIATASSGRSGSSSRRERATMRRRSSSRTSTGPTRRSST